MQLNIGNCTVLAVLGIIQKTIDRCPISTYRWFSCLEFWCAFLNRIFSKKLQTNNKRLVRRRALILIQKLSKIMKSSNENESNILFALHDVT